MKHAGRWIGRLVSVRRRGAITVILLAAGLRPAAGGVVETAPLISQQGAHWIMTDGRPVTLKNNPAARDPSLAELIRFIKTDQTNLITYVPGRFVCTEFAVRLHNQAEQAGLRAAVVFVTFVSGPGHALTAFQTRDRGLVFIDCTGGTAGNPAGSSGAFDTFGYLVQGRPYGRLPLDVGIADPASYALYEKIKAARVGIEAWAKWIDEEKIRLAAESGEIARVQAGAPAGGEAARLKEMIGRYNERSAAFNAKVEILNRFSFAVQESYTHNPAPVAEFELRW
jgi:hypothetical protein